MTTKIEWTEETWNPLAGCSKVSPGCKNCYAIKEAHRLEGNPNEKIATKYAGTTTADGKNWTGRVNFSEDALTLPLSWRKPRRVFVNSMSDLFHESVSDEWIDKIFAVMALSPQHTFQVLTKRPERMRGYINKQNENWTDLGVSQYADEFDFDLLYEKGELKQHLVDAGWWLDWSYTEEGKKDICHPIYGGTVPFPNVWLGVSVENQETADERIPLLLQTPAAVRWLSVEPLLGPINLHRIKDKEIAGLEITFDSLSRKGGVAFKSDIGIDWVVVGGESGAGARPMHPDWARSLRDQCNVAGVPFFFKQWGAWMPESDPQAGAQFGIQHFNRTVAAWPDGTIGGGSMGTNGGYATRLLRVGKKAAGRLLDGREWNEYPIV